MARSTVFVAALATLLFVASWILVPAGTAVGAAAPAPAGADVYGGPELAFALHAASVSMTPSAGF